MEADGLRWALLVIGSLVIVGLAVHGIWLSRKNSVNKVSANKAKSDQQYQPSNWQSDTDSFDGDIKDPDIDINEHVDAKTNISADDIGPSLTAGVAADIATSVTPENDYDDLGLGAVRVVSSDPQANTEEAPTLAASAQAEQDAHETNEIQQAQEANKVQPSKIYASVVTQPKPEYTSLAAQTVAISQQERAQSNKKHVSQDAVNQSIPLSQNDSAESSNSNYQAPEPPPFLLKKEADGEMVLDSKIEPQPQLEPEVAHDLKSQPEPLAKAKPVNAEEHKQVEENSHETLVEKLSLSEQARNLVKGKKASAVKERREPKMAEDQMHIDFDEQPVPEVAAKEELKAKPVQVNTPPKATAPVQQQEVLVLNVKSEDDNPISGAALLPMLLTLGFKFGDQDIFHRHVNANGKGPVLFSLANMFKPGNFDIDNLENFTTQGISLFMILPIEGDPHQVFNMMHNAARKITEEFSAQIYDGKRTLLTKQSLQQYVEKIREFERQRLIRG